MSYEHIARYLEKCLEEELPPSIREIALHFKVSPKLINTKYPILAGKVILKRKSRQKVKNYSKTTQKPENENKKYTMRKCLRCEKDFASLSAFNRLCETCRKID